MEIKNEVTIATHNGSQVARQHNLRNPKVICKEDHIDPNGHFEVWLDEDPKAAYERLFGEAVQAYNEKQSRPDRQITDYYKQICEDSKKKPVYELIIGIYGKKADGTPICSKNDGRRILRAFTEDWERRNPNLKLCGLYYHCDESVGVNGSQVGHVHIDYIPVGEGFTRGMAVQSSLTKALEPGGRLHLTYRAVSDRDTVFNLTNHTYFNLFGHTHPEKAMDQLLMLTARFYTFSDEESVPTGEERSVDGTPFDFRTPKAVGRDINEDYDSLKLQGGYDHNFEAFADPCAILSCPETGRTMAISTDCPGLQFYSGNFLSGEQGKDGVSYCYRGGIALETQYFPNSINIDHWKKPIYKAGEEYKTETVYTFNW